MFCSSCGRMLDSENICPNPACPSNTADDIPSELDIPISLDSKKGTSNSYADFDDLDFPEDLTIESKNSVPVVDYNSINDSTFQYIVDRNPYNRIIDTAPTYEDFLEYLNDKKVKYYGAKWEKYQINHNFISWNFPAFFFGVIWMIYRKMYSYFFMFILLSLIFSIPYYINQSIYIAIFMLLSNVVVSFVCGLFGNQFYIKSAIKRMAHIKTAYQGAETQMVNAQLRYCGKVNRWVPILIFVIIIIFIGLSIFMRSYLEPQIKTILDLNLNF